MPNKAQNRKGPAKSASSMIWLSILAIGLSTVRVCQDQMSAEELSDGPAVQPGMLL